MFTDEYPLEALKENLAMMFKRLSDKMLKISKKSHTSPHTETCRISINLGNERVFIRLIVEIQLHHAEYDVEQTIKSILEFNGFTHAQFWGKLRAAVLKTGSDIPMNRFWQHAREIGEGVFPMQNETWRKTIASFEFDYNWSIEDWRRFGERYDAIHHYDAQINENNDPVHDTPAGRAGRAYMEKWDGQAFIDEMQLSMDEDVLEVGIGTGRLAKKVAPNCRKFYGIDISPKTVERAKENLRANGNASIIHSDFMRYPFDRTYDVVYSTLTFMHIKDKGEAINKIARLLKPYGRFVLSIDKNQSEFIDMGNRKIKIYPDNPVDICGHIEAAGLALEKQFETEFAVIFAARDLKYLPEHGMKVEEVQPVDMFPWKGHVEVVVKLEKQ